MPDFAANVRCLSAAACALRTAAPPAHAPLPPFALALFTDERRQADLGAMVAALPNAGPSLPPLALIFRHYGLKPADRLALGAQVRDAVQRRGHFFIGARLELDRMDGTHGCGGGRSGFLSLPCHSYREAMAADSARADLRFVSPVFPTASHPGAPALGPARAGKLAEIGQTPAFALGGMTARTTKRLHGLPFYGIGAIGAFSTEGD